MKVPSINQTQPVEEAFKRHPTGEFTGTVAEWSGIEQTRNGKHFFIRCYVRTEHGKLSCILNGMPNTLTLLRSLMPVGSEHAIVVEHVWHNDQLYARAAFRNEISPSVDRSNT